MYSPATGWEKKLNELIANHWPDELPRDRELVLAFSGGADSVLSLYMLLATVSRLQPRNLTLFYLDHGQPFSPQVIAERNEIINLHFTFSVRMLGKHKVSLTTVRREVHEIAAKLKMSFERTASLLRRRLLLRAAQTSEALFVTGHTLSDWLETVVLRLNRGAGPAALHPFPVYDTEGWMDFFYPVAHLCRDEIRNCLKELRIPWWEDPTNHDTQIKRNLVRQALSFHPGGLRRARQNWLAAHEVAMPEKIRSANTKSQYADLQEIVPRREYHLALKTYLSIPETKRLDVLLQGLAAVGLTPVNRSVREALQKKPILHYGPWHLETENWHGIPVLVFRRGRSQLKRSLQHDGCFVASELAPRATIQLAYGHKLVKKIFSELKLSSRQRSALPVTVHPNDKLRVTALYLETFGLKNIYEFTLQ